ncbi:GerMN domain-containing protein [Pseudoclavibacter soli]|uniref:GerMN domain-containing protein n=1 Tax=Pseudoclavibacter soli TaxID=452623 RepID=UPI000415E5E7|nr:GerMN domain-containing protein [Pseudoclavibacter soli]
MRRRHLHRLHRALVGLMLVAVTASGCVRLPDSGSPERVGDQTVSGDTGYVVNASGPSDGASPEEIITGFILASADTRASHAVAREYLTDEFAQTWHPDQQVQVITDSPSLQHSDGDVYIATGQRSAVVDDIGVFRPAGDTVADAYRLTEVDGQWRIDSAPQGITLTQASFSLVYRSVSLAYLGAGAGSLVADVRWFPVGDQAVTRIASAWFAGPSPLLKGVVGTALTSDVRMAVDSVAVADGVAAVSLNADFLMLGQTEQRQVKTMLVRSLTQVSNVTDVSIVVNNVPIDVQEYSSDELDFEQVDDGRMIVVNSGGAQVLDESAWTPESDPGETNTRITQSLSGVTVLSLAVVNGRFVAATGTELRWMGADGAAHTTADIASTAVSLDRQGYAWYVSRGQITWLDLDSGDSGVLDLGGQKVQQAIITPDGSRLGVAVGPQGQTTIEVVGVARNAQGHPAETTAAVQLGTGEAVSAFSWYADDTLLWASPTDAGSTVTLAAISGQTTQTAQTTGGQAIDALVAGPRTASIRALAGGSVLTQQGTSWVDARQSFSALAWIWR